ncbi:MAG TPA: hypothetical protein VMV19_21150 [Xanthobacteraceae bacterium]|nr:hypothetical protein [Xanthobacteraceae bacterium]
MMEFGLRVSCVARVFCAAAIAACALFVPEKSHAQTEPAIVVECTLDSNPVPANRVTISIDPVSKAVVQKSVVITPNASFDVVTNGTVTSFSDEEVTWVNPAPNTTGPHTLNRYTGHP